MWAWVRRPLYRYCAVVGARALIHVIDFVTWSLRWSLRPRGSRVDKPPAHRSISCAALWLHTNEHLYQKIYKIAEAVKSKGIITHIYWVPGHLGIYGNEKVDQAVKYRVD